MKQFLTKTFVSIQNAQLVKKPFLFGKQYNKTLLDFLWDKGLVKNYFYLNAFCLVLLRYKNDYSTFKSFTINSNQSYLINFSLRKLWKIRFVQILFIFSTSLGMVSLIDCKKMKIGGKIFATLN